VLISHTQDTAGPMARSVADAATLLTAVADRDLGLTLEPGGLRGARIGVARNMAGFHDRVDALFERALSVLRDRGAEVIDPADVPHAQDLEEPELEVLLFEFKADLENYLATVAGDVPRTLDALIAFNLAHRVEELEPFGQEIFETAAAKGPLSDPTYLDALATCGRLARDEGLDAVIAEHRLDAVVAPTGGPAWLIDPVNGDHYVGGNSAPAAIAGYPAITVPMGFTSGLPVGISFIGRAWSEAALVRFALDFEAATGHRRAPQRPATIAGEI